MKAVVSPAKSLDFESKLPTTRSSQPQFLEEAETLNKKLERKTKAEISDLMSISDKLADLNYQRYKEFSTPFTKENARPAVYAFAGDVYTGLDAYTIPTKKLDKLEDTLRILSGLYGVLKPFDLSLEQFNVLRILRGQNEKPLNLQDIQDRMVNKMSNTTRLIDKLLLKDFVERNTCAKNRRKIEIFITQDGLKTLSVLDPIIDDIEQQMTSNLSQTELELLNNLLTKLKA